MSAQSRPPLLLMTRPLAQAESFVTALLPDLPVTYAPLIQIRPVAFSAPRDVAGVVLTSQNAVEAVRVAGLRDLPAYCVGDKTAGLARDAGLRAHSFDGDAADLVAGVIRLNPAGVLFYPHGAHTRGDVAAQLTKAGLRVHAVTAYQQQPLPLPDALRQDLAAGARAIVPLFSPRTAMLFAAQCPEASGATVICLSPNVRAALGAGRYKGVTCSAAPNRGAMAQAILRASGRKPLEGA